MAYLSSSRVPRSACYATGQGNTCQAVIIVQVKVGQWQKGPEQSGPFFILIG